MCWRAVQGFCAACLLLHVQRGCGVSVFKRWLILAAVLVLFCLPALAQGDPPPPADLNIGPAMSGGVTQMMNVVEQGMPFIVKVFAAVVGVTIVMNLVYTVLGKGKS